MGMTKVDFAFEAIGVDALLLAFGSVVDKIEAAVEASKSALKANIVAPVVSVINDVFDRVKFLADGLLKLAAPVTTLVGSLTTFGTGIKSLSDLLSSKFMSVVGKLQGYIGQISPAGVTQLNYAMEDLMATIGEKLEPLFQVLVTVVERVGDALANIDLDSLVDSVVTVVGMLADAFFQLLDAATPLINMLADTFAQVIEALVPPLEAIIEAVMVVMDALGPLIELLGTVLAGVLEALHPIIELITSVIKVFADALIGTINVIADIVETLTAGMVDMHVHAKGRAERNHDLADKDGKTRTRGKGGVSVGGIEEASRRALEAAGKMGVTAHSKRTADNTDKMVSLLDKLLTKPVDGDPNETSWWLKAMRGSATKANAQLVEEDQ